MPTDSKERWQCIAQPVSRNLSTGTILIKALMWNTTVPVVSSSSGIITSLHHNLLRTLLVCLNLVPIPTGASLRPFFRSVPTNLTAVSAGHILLTHATKAGVYLFNH